MIKLVAVDLDDTLLRRDKTVSPYTREVFARLKDFGVITAFSTSRSERACERFSRIINPDLIISNGGALARRGGETRYKAVLPEGVIAGLVEKFLTNPDVKQFNVTAEKGYFNTAPIDPSWAGWVDYSDAIHTDFTKPIDFGEVYKIVCQCGAPRVIDEIAAQFPGVFAQGYSGEDWYGFRNKDGNKGAALKAVCSALNIALEETAAFGDDINDVTMLEAAGVSVAMANAVEEVKKAAKYHCGDCDEDGVAKWIEKNVYGGNL